LKRSKAQLSELSLALAEQEKRPNEFLLAYAARRKEPSYYANRSMPRGKSKKPKEEELLKKPLKKTKSRRISVSPSRTPALIAEEV